MGYPRYPNEDIERFDQQFVETEDERAERWRRTKERRIAAGKCWQCAKPIAVCKCGA